MSMTRKGIQGLSIIFESPVTLAATGLWIPFGSLLTVILAAAGICISFGSLLPVILVATGIQSPFPHPTWFVSAGMFHLGRQPVHPARVSWHNSLGP